MRIIKRAAIFLAAVTVVLGVPICSHPEEPPPVAADYYPLEPGDSWTYHFGGENGTARYEVAGYSDKCKGYVIMRNAKMIDVSLDTELIIDTGSGRMTLKGGTEIASGDYVQVYEHPEVLLSSPIRPGAGWEYEKDNRDNNLKCMVRCKIVKVTDMDVKAGHFENVCEVERVTSYLGEDNAEEYREVHNEYYAPHVGLIKEELVEDANDALRAGHALPHNPPAVLLELVSYKVK